MYSPVFTNASKKYGNNRWLAFSKKINREVCLFSDLEYEHWLLVECDPNIKEFCEQPLKMEVKMGGKRVSSIIDMWVKYINDSEEFIEIKYTKDLEKEEVRKQIKVQKTWCELHKSKHKIKTEIDIKGNNINLSNLKILVKQVNQNIPIQEFERNIIYKLLKNNPKSLQELYRQSEIEYQKLFHFVCQLIFSGEINSNIYNQCLGINTEVWSKNA